MGAAEDFMNSFLKQYPQASRGENDLEELNKLMAEFQQQMNHTPLDDFDGISPAEMDVLLNRPFSGNSLLQLKKTTDGQLDQIPLFKLLELLLSEIQKTGALKLTVKGNLPVRVCELLFSQNLINWEHMEYSKRVREEDIPYLLPLKQYLQFQGIVKKQNNTLSLTKMGEKFMQEGKAVRFISLFLFFGNHFHWGNFYDLQDNGKCGQLGWAYSLVLLSKYGDNARESQFYSLKLIQAFEKELGERDQADDHKDAINDYHRTYAVRFFDCFANWFGLVNIERKKDIRISFFNQIIITKSTLFDQLFIVATAN